MQLNSTEVNLNGTEFDQIKLKSGGNQVCIKNMYYNENLYAAGFPFNENRRYVFTPRLTNEVAKVWVLEPQQGNFFYIKNTKYNEYLYAVMNNYNYDSERRRVFTWMPGNAFSQSEWYLEPENDYYYIRNRLFNEYLFADSTRNYDKYNRYVFTWRPGGKTSKDSKWKIYGC